MSTFLPGPQTGDLRCCSILPPAPASSLLCSVRVSSPAPCWALAPRPALRPTCRPHALQPVWRPSQRRHDRPPGRGHLQRGAGRQRAPEYEPVHREPDPCRHRRRPGHRGQPASTSTTRSTTSRSARAPTFTPRGPRSRRGGLFYAQRDLNSTIRALDPITQGTVTFTPDEIGALNVRGSFGSSVAPYVGLGVGNAIKEGGFPVGFSFELGGYYHGSPDIT